MIKCVEYCFCYRKEKGQEEATGAPQQPECSMSETLASNWSKLLQWTGAGNVTDGQAETHHGNDVTIFDQ